MSQDYNMNYINDTKQRYSDVNILSTHGRLGRKRYFVYSTVFPVLVFWSIATVAALASLLPVANESIFYAIMGIATLAALCSMVFLTIQRCHDFNKSGLLALLSIIPFANIFFALAYGTNGLNSYGEMPKPASTLLKIAFYALILILLGTLVYAFTQLPIGEYFNKLLAIMPI